MRFLEWLSDRPGNFFAFIFLILILGSVLREIGEAVAKSGCP